MRSKVISAVGLLAICSAVACEKSSPTTPDVAAAAPSAASADARIGVTQAAPQPASPADNADVKYSTQPVKLVVANGLTAIAGKSNTYTFEVATDSAFAAKVYTKADVPEGTNNQTSLTIDRLAASKTYYWRTRTVVAGAEGPNSRVRSFRVGPEVVIQPPVPLNPANGGNAGTPTSLTVRNSETTGPAGPIRYDFEVSSNPSFSPLTFSTSVGQQDAQTTATVSGSLNQGVTYYWHARAVDADNAITTPFSATYSFKPLSFEPTAAVFHDNPRDIGFWPQGAKITSIVFTPEAMLVDFDRRDGPNRWPDVVPPGFQGALQYTLGLCMNLNGTWHCSAVVQFWYERPLNSSGPPSDVSFEWFYNQARWGELTGKQPAEGETVAIFVVAGDARNREFNQATCPRVCERSDFVLVPFTSHGGVSYP